MMSVKSFSQSRIVPGENDFFSLPRTYRPLSSPGVIYCHGASQPALTMVNPQAFGQLTVIDKVASRYPVLVGDLGFDTWGNDISLTDVTAAVALIQSSPVSAKPGKVAIIGTSMGFAVATRYAVANPTKVACIAGLFPVCDIQDIRNNIGAQSGIDTAWEITYPAPLPPGAEVATRAAQLTFIPIRLWYSEGDSIITPRTVRTFARNNGCQAIQSSLTADHVDNIILSQIAPDVLTFIYQVLGA